MEPQAAQAAPSGREVIQTFFDLFAENRLEEALALLSEDLVWTIPGRSSFCGTFGKSQIAHNILGIRDMMEGSPRYEVVGMTCEGSRVAVEARSHARFKNGTIYENGFHMLLIIENGKIVSATEYMDTAHAEKVFADFAFAK